MFGNINEVVRARENIDGASFSLAPSLSLLLLELLLPVLLSLLLDELLSDLSPISSLRFKGLPH